MAKKIDIAGELNAATTEGIIADSKQIRYGEGSTVEKKLEELDTASASSQQDIDNLNASVGVDEYPAFSESKSYSAGDVVNYQGKLYRFTADHAAGAWIGTDVEETDVVKAHIVQELGDSKDKVVSQRVVTETVNNIQARINLLLGDVSKIFHKAYTYIYPSTGNVIKANTKNYNATDYILVDNFKDIKVTLSGNSSSSTLALYDEEKTCIYVKEAVNGSTELNFNNILAEHNDAVYAVMCDVNSLNGVVITPSVDDIYSELEKLKNNLSEFGEQSDNIDNRLKDIEENVAPKALAAYNSVTESKDEEYWNKLTDENTINNNSVSVVPFIQKVDESLYGKIAYGLTYTYQHLEDGDALSISLATIDTETPTAATKVTPYFTHIFKTFNNEKKETIEIPFDEPIVIRDGTYIQVVRASEEEGGAAGNGTSSLNFYNKNGETIWNLPYSAVRFIVHENCTLGAGLIISQKTIRKDVDNLKLKSHKYQKTIRKDVDYGASLYAIVGFVGATNDDSNKDYLHSDYIDISDVELMSFPTTYDGSHFTGAVFYDSNKKYIGVVGEGNENNAHYYRDYNVKENMPNAKYVIFCNNIHWVEYPNRGVVLKYSSPSSYITDTYLSTINKGIKLYLPEKIYCLVGRTLQIFKRSILYAANIDNFIIDVEVVSGNNRFTLYPNFTEFSPLSGDGNIETKFIIRNNLGDIITERHVTCVAVEVPQSPSQIKNILFVGDSWTQAIYPEEVSRMLCGISYSQPSDANFPEPLNLTNINFIGTNNNEAYSSNTYREGASGKTLAYHLSSNSPFYDANQQDIDFTIYMNSGKVKGSVQNPSSGDKIDIIVLIHGRNSIPNLSELDHFVQKAKEHNTNVKILIGLNNISATLNNAIKAGGIRQYANEEFVKKGICDKYENVYPLQVDLGLDTRYNMICQEINVNYRNTKYKELANNFGNIFHPNDNGYLQLADEVLFQLCNIL